MLDKMTKYLIKPIRVFVFLIVLLMCVLIIIQIFCRFVLNWSVPWTEEMARLCFLWMIFLGSAIVECDGGQVTTELLVKKMKTSSRLVLQTVIYLLEIVFNACLFIGAITSRLSHDVIAFLFLLRLAVLEPDAEVYEQLVVILEPRTETEAMTTGGIGIECTLDASLAHSGEIDQGIGQRGHELIVGSGDDNGRRCLSSLDGVLR